MKILYIVHTCQMHGATIALLNLLDGVMKCGVIPYLICPNDSDILLSELTKRGIQYSSCTYYTNTYPPIKSFRSYFSFIFRLFKLLRCNLIAQNEIEKVVDLFHPDIIHTNVGVIDLGFKVSLKKAIPHVWHLREYQKADFNLNYIPSLRFFRTQVSHSNVISISSDIAKYFNITTNGVTLFDGVFYEKDVRYLSNKEKYFLFVGRLEDSKGIKSLIDVFMTFCKFNTDYKLLIAGDGSKEYKKSLDQFVSKSIYRDRIVFLGFRKDRYDLMSKATALIVPSRCEGFGFITVEGIVNGCLVIGRNSGGTREILYNAVGDDYGFLFDDEKELLDIMLDVSMADAKKYYNKIRSAQQYASRYSCANNSFMVYKYYQSILANIK